MTPHRIAVMPGDGIGKEVVPEGLRALEAAARKFAIAIEWREFDWNCDYYAKHGRMMPEDWFETLSPHDAIFYGAVGWPAIVPDHVSLWGSLIQFRRRFDQYVNLRPCRLMPGIPSAAREPQARRHRFRRRPREHRRRVFVGRRADVRGHRARDRVPGIRVLAQRCRPDPASSPSISPRTRKARARHVGDQVERHRDHDAVLGRALSRDGGALSRNPHRPVPHRHPGRAFRAAAGALRRRRRVEPVRRHPVRSRPRGVRNDRHRAVGQHQSRARHIRRCSSRCTARRPTSPARASPIRSGRSGRAR